MPPYENITEAITGITPFPEAETVFAPEQPWLAKHFLPLVPVDLGLIRGELAGTVVHLVNPFEPYEGYIGETPPNITINTSAKTGSPSAWTNKTAITF